jgi:mannose-6-phosphate isomerase
MPSLLQNPIRDYAWGSVTAIPEMLGTEPTGEPQAELWMGAHEGAPSILAPSGKSLYDAVAEEPDRILGAETVKRFDGRFPFLAKILAAGQPLSIQAHPSPEQAREGFAREDAEGVPRDAAERNYRDPWPKPEMLIALGTFDALVGFRPVERTLALLEALDAPPLDRITNGLRDGGLREVFTEIMETGRDDIRPVVAALGEACRSYAGDAFALEAASLDRLSQDFPDDPGVLAALLLNRVRLERFEAVYLPAGNVHAYLHGTGFEVMANSDNVLRGGLTSKHIDVSELVSVVDFEPLAEPVVRAETVADPAGEAGVSAYEVGCGYFDVRRVDLDGRHSIAATGPRIVVCVEGTVELDTGGEPVVLGPGRSAFAGADEPPCNLRGRGIAFVVAVKESHGT